MRSSSSLAVAALNKWKKALLEIQSREQLADAFHMSHLAIVAIHHWRTRLRQKVKMVRVARAASQYFQMRRAWFRWVEMLEAKRRERLLQAFEGRLKKRRFELWLQKTRVKKERESAVQRMHEQITRVSVTINFSLLYCLTHCSGFSGTVSQNGRNVSSH